MCDHDLELVSVGSFYQGLGRPGKLLWEGLGWPSVARRSHADVLHSPYLSTTMAAENHVMTVHDLIGFVLPDYARTPWMRAYNALARLAATRATLLLADSEFTAGDINRVLGISRDRIRVVPLGVNPRLAPQPQEVVEQFRAQYGLTESFVLYLGSGDKRKGLDVLLKSWFIMPSHRRPLLVLAGHIPCTGSDLFPDYRKLADGLGLQDSVRFLGPVAEAVKPTLISAADAFLFPSFYEGFGLEPLEAMACGTPVICSSRTSMPEVVGDAAILTDPNQPHEWADRVLSLLQDAQMSKRLVKSGLTRSAEFTWEKTARLTMLAYSEVL